MQHVVGLFRVIMAKTNNTGTSVDFASFTFAFMGTREHLPNTRGVHNTRGGCRFRRQRIIPPPPLYSALQSIFIINCIMVEGDPINGHPGGSNTQISTKNDPKY